MMGLPFIQLLAILVISGIVGILVHLSMKALVYYTRTLPEMKRRQKEITSRIQLEVNQRRQIELEESLRQNRERISAVPA